MENEIRTPEIDAWLAIHLFGWEEMTQHYPGTNMRWFKPDEGWIDRERKKHPGRHVLDMTCPPFSSEVSEAWDVIEKLFEKEMVWLSISKQPSGYLAYSEANFMSIRAYGDTMPEAVCQAAQIALKLVPKEK